MFVSLFVKKEDATIIEVKGGAHATVLLYLVPALTIAPKAFDDDDGMFVAGSEQFFRIVFYVLTCQFHGLRV